MMAFKNLFWEKKNKPTDIYLGLRQQALDMKAIDIGVTLDNNEQVYGAVVDMPTSDNKNIATLVCFFDGTVSLYYSTGGGLLGFGQTYEEVRKAGMSFLFSAVQVLPIMKLQIALMFLKIIIHRFIY